MSEIFSGVPGRFSELGETLESFEALLDGQGDDYPEQSFYMVGGIKEAIEKGKKLNAIV
jgi:F-type H+-transporting ATPase subunit beta